MRFKMVTSYGADTLMWDGKSYYCSYCGAVTEFGITEVLKECPHCHQPNEEVERKIQDNIKVCKIINEKFSWVMVVDGETIVFHGSNSAEYFVKHYTSLGYQVIREGDGR